MPRPEIETFLKCFPVARRTRRQPANDNIIALD